MIKAMTFDLWNTLIKNKEYTTLRIRRLKELLNAQAFAPDENAIEGAVQRLKLYQSMDAIKIDTTDISVEEAVNQILQVIGSEGKISKSTS